MKYEFGKIYKKDELPKEFFKNKESAYHLYYASYLNFQSKEYPLLWIRQEKEFCVFCPIDPKDEKYIFQRVGSPLEIYKNYSEKLENTVDSMKELKEKINNL